MKLKIETESLIIAVHNKCISINYVKVKIDKILKNSKCHLCGEKTERVNHIINKSNKIAENEYNNRYGRVRKQYTENCANDFSLTI